MAIYHCGLLPDHWMNQRKRYVRMSESLGTVFGLPIASEYLKKNKLVIRAGISKFRPLTQQQLAALQVHIRNAYPFTESSLPNVNPSPYCREYVEEDILPHSDIVNSNTSDISRIVFVLNKHLSSISTQLHIVNDSLTRIRVDMRPKSKVMRTSFFIVCVYVFWLWDNYL